MLSPNTSMRLTSPVFANGEAIPQRFGRDFENHNPPLDISDIPLDAVSLVLIMEDPDVPLAAGVPYSGVLSVLVSGRLPASSSTRITGVRITRVHTTHVLTGVVAATSRLRPVICRMQLMVV
jgi:phosphatidylethanolamine-binding protein (PEBP) family uncharacterized protein